MKLTLESTTTIVLINGMPTRVWRGKLEDGTPVHAMIALVAVPNDAPPEVHARFERELQERHVRGGRSW